MYYQYCLLETLHPNVIGFGYNIAMLYQCVIAFVCCIFLKKDKIKILQTAYISRNNFHKNKTLNTANF